MDETTPTKPTTRPPRSRGGTAAADSTLSGAARHLRTVSQVCRHCRGTAVEPLPLEISFARGSENSAGAGAAPANDPPDLNELARATGRSRSLISRVVAGKTDPSVVTLVRLADRLGVTVDRVIRSPRIWKRILGRMRE